jgi:hypothetical protein
MAKRPYNPTRFASMANFTESTDWDDVKQRFAITDRQVLELKSVAHEFKRTTTHEYNRAQRDVNHPSNAPIHSHFRNFKRIRTAPLDQRTTIATLQNVPYAKYGNSRKRRAERNGVARVVT